MIAKQPIPGGGSVRVLIPSSYPWPKTAKHDPWTRHAVYAEVGNAAGQDGNKGLETVASAYFQLKSGEGFNYFYGGWRPCYEGFYLYAEALNFVVPGLAGVWLGEGFNFVLRRLATVKSPLTALPDILSAHGQNSNDCPPLDS